MSHARLNVLHCIYDDPANPWVGGGGARRVFDLYRHLRDRIDITIVTGAYPGAHAGEIDGMQVRRVGSGTSYWQSRLTYAAAASRLLFSASYDVAVVDHSAYSPVVMPKHRPVGATVHHLTGPVAARRWGRVGGAALARWERMSLRRALVFSATSQATARTLRAELGPDVDIVVVPSGVADELFTLPRSEADDLLYVGRLDEVQKGLDVLLDAFAMLFRVHPAVRLVIAGRGPHEASLRARARRLGIETRVIFAGNIEDARRNVLMTEAVCQILPSRFEGFGIAAAEALAAGVPLVVSDDAALREIVGDGEAGVVVPRGDSGALAAALASLLGDPEARARMSRQARVRAERFRWDVVAAAHLEYLRRIMTAHQTNQHRSNA